MTRLLFSSAISTCPLLSSSALFGLFSAPGPDVGPYDHTMSLVKRSTSMTRAFPWSTIMMLRLGSWIAKTGTFSWFGPEPVTPALPYCQTMSPDRLTTMTRLSTQLNDGATGEPPSGTPVPASRVRPPDSRSASLRPMMVPGPGLQSIGSPDPKLQTIDLVTGFTSMARLLYWSVISRLPGGLKPPLCAVEVEAAAPAPTEDNGRRAATHPPRPVVARANHLPRQPRPAPQGSKRLKPAASHEWRAPADRNELP